MVIPGFSNYDISEDGTVLNIATGKVVKHAITSISNNLVYVRVCLKDDKGAIRMHNVMKLLAETYLDKPDGAVCVRAKDGDNLHVHIDNVEYVPRHSVVKQAWDDGKMANRRPRQKRWNADTVDYVYNVLQAIGPVTLSKLNGAIDIPLSDIRYSLEELVNKGSVAKTKNGFEVIE